MRRIIDESSVPIREINPEIPDWLAQIVEKLMAKDKAGRFDSAKEVHTLLESCLSPRPATHTCRASRLAARRAGNDSAPGWAKDIFNLKNRSTHYDWNPRRIGAQSASIR